MYDFFTKEEIIERAKLKHAELGDDYKAGVSLATLIASSALYNKKLKSGQDYIIHPLHVGLINTREEKKKIVGILHDVIEDSDWTVEELKIVGFDDDVVEAVDAMSLREGEAYFDMIKRCSFSDLAIDRKLEDIRHNMDNSRNSNIMTLKTVEKIHKYMISKEYLKAVRAGKIEPGSSVKEFVSLSSVFNNQCDKKFDIAVKVADKYCKPVAKNAPCIIID